MTKTRCEDCGRSIAVGPQPRRHCDATCRYAAWWKANAAYAAARRRARREGRDPNAAEILALRGKGKR